MVSSAVEDTKNASQLSRRMMTARWPEEAARIGTCKESAHPVSTCELTEQQVTILMRWLGLRYPLTLQITLFDSVQEFLRPQSFVGFLSTRLSMRLGLRVSGRPLSPCLLGFHRGSGSSSGQRSWSTCRVSGLRPRGMHVGNVNKPPKSRSVS